MKLISIDIESPLPDVAAPAVGEQWVLVRLHAQPLGMLRLPPRGYDARELAGLVPRHLAPAILHHLVEDGLWRGGEPAPWDLSGLSPDCPQHLADTDLLRLTVAVCTRNGVDRIGECLDALSAIDYPAHLLDLVVVDNAPQDDRLQRVIADRYPGMRYVVEARPGLDRARNRAVLESRGDIVAFTDDDVSVDRGWARAIARVFVQEPDAMAVTGLVVPDETDVAPQLLFEMYGGFGRGFRRRFHRIDREGGELAASRYGGAGQFGTGANMAFRRRVFDAIGLFDPALDVGTVTNGGGDLDMFFRVIKEGHLLVYEPAAIVRHRHRRTYAALRTQLANNGIGFYSYLVRAAGAYPDERGALARLGVWWFWRWNLRRLAVSWVRPRSFPRDLVWAELRGSIAGLRRYARARRHARDLDGVTA